MKKKRMSFGKVFWKRWLLVVGVLVVVYTLGILVLADHLKSAAKKDFYESQSWLVEKNVTYFTELEGTQSDNFSQFYSAMLADTHGVMSLIYDADTGEKNAGCEEKLFLLARHQREDDIEAYVCNLESLPGWEKYRQDTKECYGKFALVECILQESEGYFDIYTDGTFFYPKTLKLELTGIQTPGKYEEALYSFDRNSNAYPRVTFTAPKILPEGYTEKNIEDYSFKAFQLMGYHKNSPYMNRLDCSDLSYERLLQFYERSRNKAPESIQMEGMGVQEQLFRVELASETELPLVDKNYILITTTVYDVWELYGVFILIGGVVILLLGSLIALIMSKISYTRLKAKYEVEDYRRNLMNTMAHDLKSPLMSISGYAENLRDNVHSEKREYYADSIIDNVQYMDGMIESILALSKAEERKVVLEKSTLNVAEVLQNCIRKQELLMQEKELTAEVEGSLTLEADTTLFSQVLSNLVDNAVKYAAKGSTIKITLNEKELSIQNPCEQDLSAVISTLCEPFQVGDSSRGNKKGSGLGLAIVKNICELHGFVLQIAYQNGIFEAKVKIQEKK